MASKKARKPNQAQKNPRRSHLKKQPRKTDQQTSSSSIVSSCSSTTTSFCPQETNHSVSVPSSSPAKMTSPSGGGGCCTPESQKCRIPEMLTCPPAPKKQRVRENRMLRRRQIVFFAPPEIELFFLNAHNR